MLPLKPDPAAARDLAVRSLVRAAIATGIANVDRGTTTARYAAKAWPDDDGVPLVLRGATAPTAREDYPQLAAISTAFLASLVPMSAGADLFGRTLSLSFGPVGTISVPALNLPNADFVREREAIPVSESQAAAATLAPCKIKSIVLATWELLRNPAAEDLLRTMLIESVGPALDGAVFSTAPAAPERPAGLLNGIGPLISTGNLTDDLVAVLSAIAPVSGNSQIAVVAAPDKAVAINLLSRELPYPILTSASLPSGTLIALALNAVVSATEGAPRIDASTQAVVHAETAPATDIGGGVSVRPVRSMFQTDTVALRLTWGLSWALRDPRGVAWT